MKTGEDFRWEFPDVDEGFRDAAHRALLGLHAVKEEKQMKLRPMIAIALALILIMGVGVAATWERWSLDDFIPTERITATENEWREMIEAFEPVTVEGTVADVTVREALFDGYAVYIVVDVTPHKEGDFLIPYMTELNSPASAAAKSLPGDLSVQEYAESYGYNRIFKVNMDTGLRGITFLPEMEVNGDGTSTFYLRQRLQHGGLDDDELEVRLGVYLAHAGGVGSFGVDVPLTLKHLPVVEEAFSRPGDMHEFICSGVLLSGLRLVRTPLSTYVTVDAKITNDEAYEDRFGNYKFCFIGPDGKEYDAGPFNLSGFMRDSMGKDAEPGELYYMATLTMQEIPDTLRLIETPWGVHAPDQATDSWTIQLEHAQ